MNSSILENCAMTPLRYSAQVVEVHPYGLRKVLVEGAPEHLKVMWINPPGVAPSVKVGDRGFVTYVRYGSASLWQFEATQDDAQ